MGAKQTRTGQQFLLFAACCVMWTLTLTGCLHWTSQPPGEKQLREARNRFAAGDYRNALEISQRVMAQFPEHPVDQSLFQIGMVYAHPDNPQRNIQKAMQSFQGIIDRCPASHLQAEARLWLAVLGRLSAQEERIRLLSERNAPLEKALKSQKRKINRLQDQLEKLKRIDIRMEEKKRETIPPAEDLKEKGNGEDSGS